MFLEFAGDREIRAIAVLTAEDIRRLDPVRSIAVVDPQLSCICHTHEIIVGMIRDDDYAVISASFVERRAGQVGYPRSAYCLRAVVLGILSMLPRISTSPLCLKAISARVTVSRTAPINSAI